MSLRPDRIATDYDGQSPPLELPRAVVLVSVLTELTRRVAYEVSERSGTVFHDIDLRVENEARRSLAILVHQSGERAYRTFEARCLTRAVRERPSGVVALGDGGLLTADNRTLIAHQADLVVLDLELPSLFWRIQMLCRERGSMSWSPLMKRAPQRPDDLRSTYESRMKKMTKATCRFDANGREVSDVAGAVHAWLAERYDTDGALAVAE